MAANFAIWPRRVLFFAVNAAIAILIFATLVLPLRDYFDARDADIIERSEHLARWKSIAAQEDDIKTLLARSKAMRGELSVVSNEGAASAEIQGKLRAFTIAAGGNIRTMLALPSRTRANVKFLAVRIDIAGSIAAIQKLAYAVETARPYLYVTTAALRPSQFIASPGQVAEPTLEAQFEIIAPVEFRE